MGTTQSKARTGASLPETSQQIVADVVWSSTILDIYHDKALRARLRYWADMMRADELSGMRGWDRFDRPIRTEHAYPFGHDVTVRHVGDPVPSPASDPLITRDPGAYRRDPGVPRHGDDGYIGYGIRP